MDWSGPTSILVTGSAGGGRASGIRVGAAASLATMCSALPVFLLGALSVQVRQDLGLSVVTIGLVSGVAFASAGATSALMGRVGQRLGPATALRVGLSGTGTVLLLVGLGASEPWQLMVLLGLSGLCNALNQPSANLLLADRIPRRRLGLALAVKQSGMPGAALLGGAAVPAIALTVGWRWAFLVAAGLALVAIVLQPRAEARPVGASVRPAQPNGSGRPRSVAPSDRRARPDMSTRLLALYGAVGLLGAFTAAAMINLFTSAATEAGIGEGEAGWLLSFGSALGIASRLTLGWLVDRGGMLPIQRVVWLLAIGAGAMAALATTSPWAYLVAVVPAFAGGWAWPGLLNLSVIRNNPSAPATATGITQTGTFIGAGLGPLVGGLVVDAVGYRPFWLMCGLCLLAASTLAMFLRRRVMIAVRRSARRAVPADR